jgi:hypothetical protein
MELSRQLTGKGNSLDTFFVFSFPIVFSVKNIAAYLLLKSKHVPAVSKLVTGNYRFLFSLEEQGISGWVLNRFLNGGNRPEVNREPAQT